MRLKTIVIDDEPIALEKLKKYAGKVPFLELVAAFDNSLDALEFLSVNEIDMVVTDIDMPDLNGMEMIGSLSVTPLTVFTTAYEQYAVDSYRVRAVDYLLKPFSFADFRRAASRALEMASLRAGSTAPRLQGTGLFVKTDTRYIKIDTADILYIKGFGEYLQIFLRNRPLPLVTLSSFAAILERLGTNFLQVHRSYVVNMDNILMADRGRIMIDNETPIPISDGFRAEVLTYLASHSVGRNSRQ